MKLVRVETGELNLEECTTLAELTRTTRKGTILESSTSLEEMVASIQKISENNNFKIILALDERESITGWIYYYIGFPLMTFISGFYPVVRQNHDSEEVAVSLIEEAKRDLIMRGHSRLEIELELPTVEHRSLSEGIIGWYRKTGFAFAAEEAHMVTDLNSIELPVLAQPIGFTLRKFSEVSYEQLEESGFQTFEESRDDLFLSMSHDEQKITLEHFFDKSEPFIEDASLVLKQTEKVVGFVITRIGNGIPEIGPIGLIPEVRGQGLANYLLVVCLNNLRKIGKTRVELDMSISNHAARRLYQRYGFSDDYYKQFYYWSP